MTVDEHTFAVVQAAADAERRSRVRLAALFHDLGKPHVAWRGTDGRLHYYAKPGYSTKSHEQVSAELAAAALARLRYPTELRRRVVRIVRVAHARHDPRPSRCARASCSRATATRCSPTCSTTRRPTCAARATRAARRRRSRGSRGSARSSSASSGSPHRIRDLAVDGNDLIAIGFAPGPALGSALAQLLEEVVREPELNTQRGAARARAKELRAVIRWDEPGYVVAFTTRAAASATACTTRSTSRRGRATTPSASPRTGAAPAPSSGSTRRGSRSTARCTRRPCTARAGRGEQGDGLWSDEPGLPMLAFSADCLPIAIARTDGARRLARRARGLARAREGRRRRGRRGGRRARRPRSSGRRSARAATRSAPRCRRASTTI